MIKRIKNFFIEWRNENKTRFNLINHRLDYQGELNISININYDLLISQMKQLIDQVASINNRMSKIELHMYSCYPPNTHVAKFTEVE